MRLWVFLLLLAGCAPGADLKAPIPEAPQRPAGTLAIVRLAEIVADGGAEDAAGFRELNEHPRAFWAALEREIESRFQLERVTVQDPPARVRLETLTVLSERPRGAGWEKLTMRMASDPAVLAGLADVVVVLDEAELVLGAGDNSAARQVSIRGSVALYRDGAFAWAGRVSSVGTGKTLERVDRQTWGRAVRGLAEQLGTVGRWQRRR